jgi:formylglycine-generating enzyme required for sulfatase activity
LKSYLLGCLISVPVVGWSIELVVMQKSGIRKLMQKKNIISALLISASLLLTMGCNPKGSDDGENGDGGVTPTVVTFESVVAADGADGTATTTELTLTFSADPTTLTAEHITVAGATKGALTGSGTTRTLGISNITVGNGETVSIAIANPDGFTISGMLMAVVYKNTRIAVTFESAVQTGGTSGTVSSTGLTLAFSADPTTLTAQHITVNGVTKGALTGSGTTRTLGISNITVGNGETVSVAIANPDGFAISGLLQTAVVYKDTRTFVTFEDVVQTGGISGTANSTGLTLHFSADPTTLTAEHITVVGATKGALTGTGTTRSLAISNISVGDGEEVSVTIANPSGYDISGSPKTAVVYKTVDNGENYISANIGDLIYVPAGRFQRDATATNISEITQPYLMSQHEITRAQFLAIMGTDPSNTNYSSGTNDPVQRVNWYHAIAFTNKLSLAESLTPVYTVSGVDFSTLTYADIPISGNADWDAATATWTNNGYRLPTEMEWMWAAMGAPADGQGGGTNTTGHTKAFAGSNGSNVIGDYAVYGENSGSSTHPVGSKLPNELGVYDMSGNVWEWTWDRWGSYPAGTLTDYRGAASGSYRVNRGGNWNAYASICTVAFRGFNDLYNQFIDIGFRVVRP